MQQQQPVKKKILFLITKSNWGGAQRYVRDLAVTLSAEQYDVVVALGGNGILKEKLETAGIRTITLMEMQNETSFKRIAAASRELEAVLKEEQPDVLHINSSLAGIAGTIAGKKAKVPRVIFTAHAWAFNENRSLLQRIVLKVIHWITVRKAAHTITVSDAVKKQMNWPLVKHKMTTIHNGRPAISFKEKMVARQTIAEHEPRLGSLTDSIWTGCIGELHPVKRHDVMIQAVATLVATGYMIRHIIIGDGELKTELQEQINALNLQQHVFLLGHLDEAATLLKAFDIYVQPSRSEALAYTVIEAAQAGLPIIASRVGGLPEVIEHEKEGVLVEPENSDELAEAVKNTLQNKDISARYATAAHQKSTEFTLEAMLTKTIAVYESTNSSRT